MDVDIQSSPVGYLEKFVFSENRDETLKDAVKGSEEYYMGKLTQLSSKIEKSDLKNEQQQQQLWKEMKQLHDELEGNEKLKYNSTLGNLRQRNEMHFLHVANSSVQLWEKLRQQLGKPYHTKPSKQTLVTSENEDENASEVKQHERSSIDGSKLAEDKLRNTVEDYCLPTNYQSLTSLLSKEAIVELCTSDMLKKLISGAKTTTSFILSSRSPASDRQKKLRRMAHEILNDPCSVYILNDPSRYKLVLELIEMDLFTRDDNNNDVSFGSRYIHSYLTLNQMNDLLAKSNDSLLTNVTFLTKYFVKSLPTQCSAYYSKSALFADEMPADVLLQFHTFISTFINSYLKLPSHSTVKAILLFYLINCQYEKDVFVFFFFLFLSSFHKKNK
ncbi:hypothetical protein RFI_05280 [Reticulomyxa filosa]|uniref:Uncharacterized protein n=1 Tax=Reticulomyxa filosa TaxID=46433 RepID=X6P182_RETFI|nr:hypothetical protein RFI_05280 [Reticulomyxa filosa]|eukprot:ETO31834.1 hypothetical protein RFI_05280 [Reticulomyxa filosa]